MTVADQSYAPILQASNALHEYDVNWLPVEDGDLVVKVQVGKGWVTANYTVSEKKVTVTDTDTVTVTTSGYTHVFIYRKTKVSQNTQFLTLGDFSPKIHADAFDKLTRMVQEIDATLDKRVVKLEVEVDKVGFTPVIKGEVPEGGLITATADGFEVSTEKETAIDKKISDAETAMTEQVGEATTQAGNSKTSADTSEAWAQGTPSSITGKSADKSSKAYSDISKARAAEATTKLTAIESITGRIADPSDVHHVLNIEQYVETASLFAYGDKLTRDFNTATGPNQLYWDTTSVKGFPKAVGANDDADEPKIEARAYVIERRAKDSSLPKGADLTTYGPEQFITQIKSIVAQNVSKTGAALERVLDTKKSQFWKECKSGLLRDKSKRWR